MNKVLACRAFGIVDGLQLMTHVYLGLYPELQQLVVEPSDDVTLSEYIEFIEQKCKAQKNVLTISASFDSPTHQERRPSQAVG